VVAVSVEGEWLDLVGDLLAGPLVELPVETIALGLNDALQGTGTAWSVSGPGGVMSGALYPLHEQYNGHRAEIEAWAPRGSRYLHPVLLQYRVTGWGEVVQVADVPDRFVPGPVRGAWHETARPWGCAEQVSMPLGVGTAFVVGRPAVFTPVELALAARLRHLLVGLHRHVRATAALRPDPAVAADLRLSARQLAVLGLLAAGLTSAAIGRRLGISERTVHKHLEHLYARLGVSDRVSAVLRARDAGLLAPPTPGPRGADPGTQVCVSR
jgi:DNA-binding CsgD family transcriptional regulator